jgi:hypothetical protein
MGRRRSGGNLTGNSAIVAQLWATTATKGATIREPLRCPPAKSSKNDRIGGCKRLARNLQSLIRGPKGSPGTIK